MVKWTKLLMTFTYYIIFFFLQVHKENAPECLTIVHYTELADKGLILMRGEFDKVSFHLN